MSGIKLDEELDDLRSRDFSTPEAFIGARRAWSDRIVAILNGEEDGDGNDAEEQAD